MASDGGKEEVRRGVHTNHRRPASEWLLGRRTGHTRWFCPPRPAPQTGTKGSGFHALTSVISVDMDVLWFGIFAAVY